MSDKYKLVGHEAVPVEDLIEWGKWFETADRRVALDYVPFKGKVSTVFLGLDHSFGSGPPLLFETMIFAEGSPLDQEQDRYSTWDEAVEGHRRMLERFVQSTKED